MDSNKIASELVKIAKELTAKSEYETHSELWGEVDRELEPYQEFIKNSALESSSKKAVLKAIKDLSRIVGGLDGKFFLMTEHGEAFRRNQM
jgi:uncharacterized coiled-coil DUF342 family protein